MTISIAPLLKRQCPSRQHHASHGWIEMGDGKHWHPSRAQPSFATGQIDKSRIQRGMKWLFQIFNQPHH